MSRLRFATARTLFDAFPEVSEKVAAKPTDQSPVDFLKALASANRAAGCGDVLCLPAAAARGGLVGLRMREEVVG